MEKFRINEQNMSDAITFIKTGKGKPPRYATKYKDQLTVRKGKLYFDEREVVPLEKRDATLRALLYDKDSDTPFGRDSAFHVIKQKYLGISKNYILEFLRKQKPLQTVVPIVKQPKKPGKKLKKHTFEIDLIFVRQNDVVEANRKFARDNIRKKETYVLSCVEKITGYAKFKYFKTKTASKITSAVISLCKVIADKIGVKLGDCPLEMDGGSEFQHKKLNDAFGSATVVQLAPKVEQHRGKRVGHFLL